uniref:Uncharacterized protein n=1 Tax=Cucumis melo TaxID=3656 RepID=A0A9I9DGX1_CUCME
MALSQVNAKGRYIQKVQQVADMGCVGCGSPHKINACPLNTETISYIKGDSYSKQRMKGGELTQILAGGKSKMLNGDKVAKATTSRESPDTNMHW